jgi:hypothetical protein
MYELQYRSLDAVFYILYIITNTGLFLSFSKKSGKYAIRGFPHKLGLLLHGPPGR